MTRSSIIEQAARRLEELKRSGVKVPPAVGREPQPGGARVDHQGTVLPGAATADKKPNLPTRATLERTQPQSGGAGLLTNAKVAAGPAVQRQVHLKVVDGRSNEVEIDLARLGRMGFVVPGDSASVVAREFRQIKRPLLRNVARDESHTSNRSSLIMITSAVAGEGKTFCSINLAMSIAMEVDTSVLLVDADVVRPALLERLGLSNRLGLLDVLTGDVADLASVIVKTNIPKLSILPAGAPRAMATELLASAAMDELLLDLATRYPDRVIVLDAPPLLLTTESQVLASRVGQVVVVVDAERTPTHKVTQAFAAVESCPVVLSLLNKCSEPAASDGYGYGY